MAKGPELTSAATNPDHAQHVANVSNMIGSATPEQRIGGIGWYRSAAQDTMHIASGIEPGTLTPHPTQGDAGLYRDKPGSTNLGSQFTRHELQDNHARQMGHARGLGQEQAESYARSGRYQGQQTSAANDAGRLFGVTSMAPHVRDVATSIAAMSPAGPTGMTWDNNPRAVGNATHLNGQQFDAIAHANTIKPGTPERAAASQTAREPFKGTALNHQTTGNVEKGLRALHGEYQGVEHPLGQQKTQHFANDIYNEVSPGYHENHTGMTGTVDKHQEDVIAGVTKPWGTAKGQRRRGPYRQRPAGGRARPAEAVLRQGLRLPARRRARGVSSARHAAEGRPGGLLGGPEGIQGQCRQGGPGRRQGCQEQQVMLDCP